MNALRVIAVVENPGGPVRAALEKAVGGRALVTAPGEAPPPYDIVVWAQNPCPSQTMPLTAHALAVCGENAGQALSQTRCDMVVTYGFSVRDTLTPSSTLDEGRVVALQRGLIALDGAAVEPTELSVSSLSGDMETRMAVAAVCLLLGSHEKNGGKAGNISFS